MEVHVTAEAVGEKVAEGGDPLIPRTKTIPELLDRAERMAARPRRSSAKPSNVLSSPPTGWPANCSAWRPVLSQKR